MKFMSFFLCSTVKYQYRNWYQLWDFAVELTHTHTHGLNRCVYVVKSLGKLKSRIKSHFENGQSGRRSFDASMFVLVCQYDKRKSCYRKQQIATGSCVCVLCWQNRRFKITFAELLYSDSVQSTVWAQKNLSRNMICEANFSVHEWNHHFYISSSNKLYWPIIDMIFLCGIFGSSCLWRTKEFFIYLFMITRNTNRIFVCPDKVCGGFGFFDAAE